MGKLFAGTSGFAYPQWKPRFYPESVPQRQFLKYYASRLNCVEIDCRFRRLPRAATLESWVKATAPGFLFCLKAHVRITHILRLGNAAEFTEAFFRAIDPLRAARRLGPVLFQPPPRFPSDTGVLADFLALLPRDIRFAFEFRHASRLSGEVYRLLEQRNICLCLAEPEKLDTPKAIAADFAYFRLRKPEYPRADLDEIQESAGRLAGEGKDVFVFFEHEDTPEGALYAEGLLRRAAT